MFAIVKWKWPKAGARCVQLVELLDRQPAMCIREEWDDFVGCVRIDATEIGAAAIEVSDRLGVGVVWTPSAL